MKTEVAEPTLIGSVQRALRLVDIVANSPRPLPVKALATATGLTQGTTYNLVRTLISEGYLVNEPEGLMLGARFPAFQTGREARGVFLARVRAALREVTETVGATAYLSRYHEGEMHLVDVVDVARNPRVTLQGSFGDSAHATALGKQILTGMPDGERIDYLDRHGMEDFTPSTICDRGALLTQLERSQGFAVDVEEYAIGSTCIAVPVIAPQVTASLAVSLPSEQAKIDRSLVSTLQRTARRLSLQLGADSLEGGFREPELAH